MTRNQQMLRDLEQALAAQEALKQQRADMIHTVATSPSKKKKVVAPQPPPRPPPAKKQPKQQVIAAGGSRHAAHANRKPSSRTIPAFRPPSPTDFQDTIGREIDAHITKSVANMLQTPVPSQQAPRIVPLQALGHAFAEQQQHALTPTFLTAKRRNMHCELDEPGYGVPFPHRKSKGFFTRLFSCFAPPQTGGGGGARGSPPSPFLIRTPSRPRPPSAKVTPPTLKLTSEMAPLRQSLASLKPGVLAAALADGSTDNTGNNAPSTALTLVSDQQQPLSGGTPPTPQFAHSHFPPRPRGDTWIAQEGDAALLAGASPEQDALHSEASFESLEAELSDNEDRGMPTPGAAMYRRTPVAGADGRPLVQRRRQPSPEQQQEEGPIVAGSYAAQQYSQLQQRQSARGAEAAHALQLQAALMQGLSVPLPPGAHGKSAVRSHGASASAGEVKQTQVSLAALMDASNSRNSAAMAGAVPRHHLQQQQGQYYQDIRSAPVSPQKRALPSAAVNSRPSVPQAPVGASAASVPSLSEQQQQQHRRPQVKSAPASRAASPLRQPTIKPRMTKASSARSEATQRLLETRRKREMAHLANLHPRVSKRKEDAMLSQHTSRGTSYNVINNEHDETIQVKRPRSAENPPALECIDTNENTASVTAALGSVDNGYQIPAAGTQDAPIPNIPPRSPGFYQMLEKLALGMSVDIETKKRVEEAKKPSRPFVPMDDQVESVKIKNSVDFFISQEKRVQKEHSSSGGAMRKSTTSSSSVDKDGGFVFNPNALFSGNAGKAELSPLVNVAAQKLVSLSDAVVAHSASGSVVASKEEENFQPAAPRASSIAVDASSGTLLGQLMELERSLTLDDLAALRHAIRREGDATEAWTD